MLAEPTSTSGRQ